MHAVCLLDQTLGFRHWSDIEGPIIRTTGLPPHHLCPRRYGIDEIVRHVRVFLVIKQEFVANATWSPAHAVRPALHAQSRRLGVCAPFFPDIDIPWYDIPSLLGVEASCDQWQTMCRHTMKDLEGIPRRTDAHVGEGGMLHLFRKRRSNRRRRRRMRRRRG